MTYRDLKKKYMLHEISREEYEKGKKRLIERLYEMYEESVIDKEEFKNKLDKLRD